VGCTITYFFVLRGRETVCAGLPDRSVSLISHFATTEQAYIFNYSTTIRRTTYLKRAFSVVLSALSIAAVSLSAFSQEAAKTDAAQSASKITLARALSPSSFAPPAAYRAFGGGQDEFEGGPIQGSRSISFSGSVVFQNSDTSGVFFGQIGYYLKPELEVGPTLGLFFSDDDVSGIAGVYGKYRFGKPRTVPYAGIGVAQSFGDQFDSDTFYQLTAGVDFFIAPQQTVFIEYQHLGKFSGGDNLNLVTFGLKFFLR
jgi:hypothetical protein